MVTNVLEELAKEFCSSVLKMEIAGSFKTVVNDLTCYMVSYPR
jgi:hypothetical protein